ncbi:hypothetical protein A6B34_16485 [Mycolicibacterium monacense]|uniref:Uncharacterized protein n=3 Tax=unclassified Mycobacterium TaxID=2642494 RepID=A0A5Q5BKT5_MYCSS|nr:hypothetical protein [Mycolicibacterium monacense DSM 44395]OBB72013.1 hypothetical protein A6B34_16485 [Mycolicibacterium monacense]OBF49422.1 hypothetical protein A5778_20550 [Mycolicibacterium monacense]ORB16919.1 hypothetical protein BST34_18990 [Mycolicibacterium monacense DSM 44395]QHP86618.1 hypothetical protein EWR22_15345 [Mycolicibacterium monacense DSM 44395]
MTKVTNWSRSSTRPREVLGRRPFARDTFRMRVEETMWDVLLPKDVDDRCGYSPRAALAELVAKQLPSYKRLLRVVTWSPDAGHLFRPTPNFRRYAVCYEVELAT